MLGSKLRIVRTILCTTKVSPANWDLGTYDFVDLDVRFVEYLLMRCSKKRNQPVTLTIAFRTWDVFSKLYSCTPVPFDDFIVNCLSGSSDRRLSCPWKSSSCKTSSWNQSNFCMFSWCRRRIRLRECLPTKHRPVVLWRRWSTHDEDPCSHILNFGP